MKFDETVIIQASFYKQNCFKPIKFSQHQEGNTPIYCEKLFGA